MHRMAPWRGVREIDPRTGQRADPPYARYITILLGSEELKKIDTE